MKLLRADDHRRMPWKNGKGVTIEIAIHPQDATVESFDWRLSTASVESDGPFSIFEGIERSLAVLTGDGIILTLEGHDHRLTKGSPPLGFPADSPTTARLIGAPITDLNAMSRRGKASHRLIRQPVSGPTGLVLNGTTCVIFCAEGQVSIANETLSALDCLRFEDCAALPLQADGQGMLYLVCFDLP